MYSIRPTCWKLRIYRSGKISRWKYHLSLLRIARLRNVVERPSVLLKSYGIGEQVTQLGN